MSKMGDSLVYEESSDICQRWVTVVSMRKAAIYEEMGDSLVYEESSDI